MKKIAAPLLLLVLNSCYSAYTTVAATHDFNEAVTFTIDKIEEGKSIVVGNKNIDAKKGYKFIFIYMTFTNKSSEEQSVDFKNISLAGPTSKTSYKLEMTMRTGAINTMDNSDSDIQSKDSMRRKLVFAAPQNMKPQNLVVNGKLMPIEYENTPSKAK